VVLAECSKNRRSSLRVTRDFLNQISNRPTGGSLEFSPTELANVTTSTPRIVRFDSGAAEDAEEIDG